MSKKQGVLFFGLVVAGIFSRLLPHPPNMTAVTAVSLFAGAILGSRILALAIPLVLLYTTDLFINNTVGKAFIGADQGFIFWSDFMNYTYLGFAAIVILGMVTLKKRSTKKVALITISASTLFWVISNFGIWMAPQPYPNDFAGMIACYSFALPYLGLQIMGDLVFSLIIFSIYDKYTAKNFQPKLVA